MYNRRMVTPRVSIINVSEQLRDDVFERIGAEPVSWPKMAKKLQMVTLHIRGIKNRAAIILKQEALSKDGEAVISRSALADPDANSDAVLGMTRRQLERLTRDLKAQPFGLKELATSIETTLHAYDSGPVSMTVKEHTFIWGDGPPLIMGILNVTPDSFSDGGQFSTLDQALAHAKNMISEGADILDVGGESTRPGSDPVPPSEQINRVVPVIEAIHRDFPDQLISIDTTNGEVARAALIAGAAIINDVSAGTDDPTILDVAATFGVPYVLMHRSGSPKLMQTKTDYQDVVSDIYDWFLGQIEHCLQVGISRSNIILDPGIGFGKTVDQNLQLINRLYVFRGLGLPVMIGPSRKRFIGDTLNQDVENREFGTAATLAISTLHGANIVRVHSVSEMLDVVTMTEAIRRENHDA
jgi:dihydropteroate synthase